MLSTQAVADRIRVRREFVFLLLAGIFLGSMTMLNILGISRFIKLFEFSVSTENGESWPIVFAIAVGVLPYPITFLCTDFISELYGRRRASWVVWIGLMLNAWVILIFWLGGELPGFETYDDNGNMTSDESRAFFEIRNLAFAAVFASMVAYLVAQFCDVYLFHFWKRLTQGKHLWLRNNGSTLVSQLVDTTAVILITHFVSQSLPLNEHVPVGLQLLVYIATGYAVKMLIALVDTIPFYFGTHWLRAYLQLAENEEVPI